MTILLFGADGQVGKELRRTLLPHGRLRAITREQVDLTDADAIRRCIMSHEPKIIVNAAAYTAVDRAESEPDLAWAINATAPRIIAECAKASGALLVHYSTDYVFEGVGNRPYEPQDATNPRNAYGITKREGEQGIIRSGCEHLIFRTSWVYSCNGHNFVKTMLTLGQQRSELRVVSDQVGAPTSAELIADVTALAIAGYRQRQLISGLYHLTAAGAVSWHGFARFIFEHANAYGFPLQLDIARLQGISTPEYPTPASRPANSRMSCTTLETALKIRMPDWTEHARRTVEQLINSRNKG